MSSYKYYEGSYHDVAVHKLMLQDVVRTEAYERAIRQVVKPGSRVMDFGCGTGIMSIFASRFGAKEVIAVDRSDFIKKAIQIAKRNDIDNIQFFHEDHKSLNIPGKVDVLISEWMGHFLFFEAMTGPLLKIRDRFLADGGVMIPAETSLHAGLVIDEYFHEDLSFLRTSPYSVDFSPIAEVLFAQATLQNFLPEQLLDVTIDLGTLNMATITTPPKDLSGEASIEKNTTIYGICGWFNAILTDEISFGTGPNDAPTHWDQIYFPLPEPFEISAGSTLNIHIFPPHDDQGKKACWRWSVSDGKKTVEMNDFKHRAEFDSSLR